MHTLPQPLAAKATALVNDIDDRRRRRCRRLLLLLLLLHDGFRRRCGGGSGFLLCTTLCGGPLPLRNSRRCTCGGRTSCPCSIFQSNVFLQREGRQRDAQSETQRVDCSPLFVVRQVSFLRIHTRRETTYVWILSASIPVLWKSFSPAEPTRSIVKTVSFFEFSLCLSRACLGKTIICTLKCKR